MAELDVKKMIAEIGYPRDVSAAFSAHGLRPASQKVVEKWSERGSMPVDRFLDFMLLIKAVKQRASVFAYIRKGNSETNQSTAVRSAG